jgi:hypothetical protein
MHLHSIQTRLLTTDYIIWRLDREGVFSNVSNGDLTFDKIDLKKNSKFKMCTAMRQVSYEFENTYSSVYMPLINQLDLKSNGLKDLFFSIALELFQINSNSKSRQGVLNDEKSYLNRLKRKMSNANPRFECNWGRIVGLFAFSGCLAIKCAGDSRDVDSWKQNIYCIMDWMTQFLNNDSKISSWIENNGGWV